MGNGCTSGHGVCGLPRLSVRSFVAVGTFMATGFAMATFRYYVNFFEGDPSPSAPSEVFKWLGVSFIIFFNILAIIVMVLNKQ